MRIVIALICLLPVFASCQSETRESLSIVLEWSLEEDNHIGYSSHADFFELVGTTDLQEVSQLQMGDDNFVPWPHSNTLLHMNNQELFESTGIRSDNMDWEGYSSLYCILVKLKNFDFDVLRSKLQQARYRDTTIAGYECWMAVSMHDAIGFEPSMTNILLDERDELLVLSGSLEQLIDRVQKKVAGNTTLASREEINNLLPFTENAYDVFIDLDTSYKATAEAYCQMLTAMVMGGQPETNCDELFESNAGITVADYNTLHPVKARMFAQNKEFANVSVLYDNADHPTADLELRKRMFVNGNSMTDRRPWTSKFQLEAINTKGKVLTFHIGKPCQAAQLLVTRDHAFANSPN